MSINFSQFTSKDAYKEVSSYLSENVLHIDINSISVPVIDGKRVLDSIVQNTKGGKKITLDEYTPPSGLVLDTFNKLGEEIDKNIKTSFLLQTFGIKGTDILCAGFCFVISLMPCSERQNLYDALYGAVMAGQIAKTASRATEEIVNTGLSVYNMTSEISSGISNIFDKSKSGDLKLGAMEKVATTIAAPLNIANQIKTVLNAIKMAQNFKFVMPDVLGKGLWDLAQNILFAMQTMALQIIDEALSKIIKPVEDLLCKLTPSICFGNMADNIRQKILHTIYSVKSRLLSEIADLFTSNDDFSRKFRTYSKQSGYQIELAGFFDALNIILANFFSLARACGVSTCDNNNSNYTPSAFDPNILNNDSENPFTYKPDSPPTININITPKPETTIDVIIKDLPELGSVTPENVINTYNLDTPPKQIIDMINNGILDNVLDQNYTIYKSPEGIKVIYKFERKCGEI